MEVRLFFCNLFVVMLCIVSCTSGDFQEIKNCMPPNIKRQSASRYFIAKGHVQIPCMATGDGKLIYKWFKDGKELDFNSTDFKDRAGMSSGVGTLEMTAIETDEGLYQCSVTNECGTSLSEKNALTLARNDPFPLLDKPTEISRFPGASLVLSCNPSESVPKAKITWILSEAQANRNYYDINDDNPGFSTVTLNKRVTMDYNGNLYITSVRKEDEQDGKTYVCQAENSYTRSTNSGEDKKITVADTQVQDMGVDLMWHSDTETLVLEGKKARFKCIFSGHPEPIITWTKVGDYDKSRSVIDHHEFTINEVQYEDAGEYTCNGRNLMSKDTKSHTFTLVVEAAPSWKSKPREMTVGVEESASFECDAYGRPTPTVKWFINGKPYEELPDNPRRVLKDNTLSFTNLEVDDSQVIQCNASNIHGSIWSDVYLYVQAIAPTIEVKPPEETVVAENQDLKVPCQVAGKPKPRVIWYKGSQILDHAKFKIMENGDLLIKQTEQKDTGTYKCTAENSFGQTFAVGKVVVRERTRIESKPIDLDIDYTNNATFRCGAATDPMENLRYHWLKNGVPLQASDHIVIEGGTLNIIGTNSKDTANYTCLAENGLDNDTATAILRIKAVPDPPYKVMVKECLPKRATIEWKFDEKMSNFDTMIKFIVEFTTDFREGVWTEVVSLAYPAETASIDLSPFVNYKFRVKAVNLMGTSEPSEETHMWCKTPMAVPEKNPENVHTDESATGYLVVKWNEVDQMDHNGPDFHYMVEVQEQGTEEVQTFNVTDYRITEKRIPVNNIYRQYIVRVRSVNKEGKALNDPETYLGYSGEAAPLVVPQNFEIDPEVNVTATSAGFRWDPVDTSPEMIRGEFSGYKIQFWKVGEKESSLHEHIIQTNPSSTQRRRRNSKDGKIRGVVANLPSYADIEAEVVVINKNFESNGSNVVNFSTPEGVPGRVEYLEALFRGSHHFLLQWGEPKEHNGIITGYQVSYRKINRLDVEPEVIAFKDLGPNDSRVTLKDLQPNSQYRIYIRAKTGEGLGAEYYIDVQTIHLDSDIILPVIQHVSTGENEANVSWEIVPAEKGRRYGQLYYIEYLKKDSDDWTRFPQALDGHNWSILKHLEPGTQYEVRVVGKAHVDGDEQHGQSYAFKTIGIGLVAMALTRSDNGTSNTKEEPTLAGAARASFFTAAWFIAMMVIIAILFIILIIVCIIKRNRGDNYPVQEKERLRGNYNEDNPDHFNDFGKGDENGVKGSDSFDHEAEKVPLDEDSDSMDYGDDEGSKFNEDGSFIGQYGRGEKGNDTNASSIV